jgi:hypothetical protein
LKFTKLKAVGIAAGVAALAFITTPANAVTITDGSGVDFDAGCVLGDPTAAAPEPNNVGSPGGGCTFTTYDGSTDSTDFSTVEVTSATHANTWNGQLVATFNVDGNIPAAGSTTNPLFGAADLPDNKFVASATRRCTRTGIARPTLLTRLAPGILPARCTA